MNSYAAHFPELRRTLSRLWKLTTAIGLVLCLVQSAGALVLDFQVGQNADLERGTNPGSHDLGVSQVSVVDIHVGDGTFITLIAEASTTLNSADVGIGVGGSASAGTARLGVGEWVALSFDRDVTVTGYTLNQVTGSDNSTYITPTSGGTRTNTAAIVTGLSLPLSRGQTITFSTTVGDGIRIATITVTVPLSGTDRFQVLRNSRSNRLDVLRNDGSGFSLVSMTAPMHGEAFISGSNVVYTPASNFVGLDSFAYTATAGPGSNATWNVTVDARAYPNFVFFLTDDQGWTGTSVRMDTNRADSASDYYRTPRLEQLAAEGLRFSMGYSPHPNCSPSRYANLTGQTCARLKMTDIVGRSGTALSNEFKLIAPGKAVNAIQTAKVTTPELLKSIPGAGYSAGHYGKWHLNSDPVSHGFDADGTDGGTGNGEGGVGPEPFNEDAKRAYSVTDRALLYLYSRVQAGTPFYLQVSHYAVHEPIQTRRSTYNSYAAVPKGVWHTNQHYAAMTTDLDINLGRVLDELDRLGVRNSTYVFYQGDNGAPKSASENYPLRGYKPEVWEGGTRTPTFVRGPGVPANSQCDLPVMGIDILPTFWHWATGTNGNLPAEVDGGSLVPAIASIAGGSGSVAPVARGGEVVHHCPHYVGPSPWPDDWKLNAKDMRPRSTIIEGKYKLVANYEAGTIELYDLAADIGQQTDLSEAELAVRWQLWVRLRDYLKLVQAQMPTLDPSYPGTTNGAFVLAANTGLFGDADADGLDDDWEFRELLTYAYDGNDDPDQDGVENAEELAQGTDPLLPHACRISSFAQVGPGERKLTWNATPGAAFVVESSTNLLEWSILKEVRASNEFEGNVTVSVSRAHEFFRVRSR